MGVATLRARALPLAIFAGTLPFLSYPAFMAAPDWRGLMLVSAALVGLGRVLLGYALWAGTGEGSRLPVTVR